MIAARIRALTAAFRRGRGGVAAVEFALIAPVLVTMLLGSVEVTHRLWAAGKVNDAANTIGDLIARSADLDNAAFDEIATAGPLLLDPYDSGTLVVDVTSAISCYKDGDTTTTPKFFVTWSRSHRWSEGSGVIGAGAYTIDTEFTDRPEDLDVDHGDTVIFTNASFTYVPNISYVLAGGGSTMEKIAFYQPRRGSRIAYTGVESNPTKTCADYFP